MICIDIDDDALRQLIEAGAVRRPIPGAPTSARLEGEEIFVPVELLGAHAEQFLRG